MAMIKLAKRSKCTGCMACSDACRPSALTIKVMADGHYYPSIDHDKCIECGQCVKACPLNHLSQHASSFVPKTMAAWSDVEEYRETSSSGGVFPTIAKYIIDNGGYVIGAYMESSIARHIVISDSKDISKLQGSKYQQSDTRGIYKQCKDLLNDNKTVLFSGTPCQVAGLCAYLKRPYSNLITIDVICAGVPSRLVIDRYKAICPDAQIISYRNKIDGWSGLHITSLEKGCQVIESTNGKILGDSIAGHQTDRYSCYNCQFVGITRCADITIGDFWGGDAYFTEQKKKGISVIIVRTKEAETILKNAGVTTHQVPLINAINKNPRIIYGKRPFARLRLERRLMKWLIPRLPYRTYASLYAGAYTKKLHFPIKLYRWFLWRLETRKSKTQVSKIINKYNGY